MEARRRELPGAPPFQVEAVRASSPLEARTVTAFSPLVDGAPPPWADTWGEDVHGVWAGFVVGEVEHRLRFIPGGTFTMGSPPEELGRFSDEEQREVTVGDFWLGETPVTQALYRAVTGTNPSRFQSPALPWLCEDRPVEGVSFEDAQAFLQRVHALRPGLGLGLPSEEEWEYACRAGTRTATYAGDLDTEYDRSAVLDRIAWYDGNAADDFDLGGFTLEPSGQEAERGTHRVGRLEPNSLGLYDMLGNVWEWCATERGAARVIRGGSWSDDARDCRAAYRLGFSPDSRCVNLGFRVSRGQAEPSRPGPVQSGSRSGRPPK